MSFWFIGDEEPQDPRFREAGMAACGLYFMAGSWCMSQVAFKHKLPAAWLVPDDWVREQCGSLHLAARLVRVGLWRRVGGRPRVPGGGYEFAWIRAENTPQRLAASRTRTRRKAEKWREKNPPKPDLRVIQGGS